MSRFGGNATRSLPSATQRPDGDQSTEPPGRSETTLLLGIGGASAALDPLSAAQTVKPARSLDSPRGLYRHDVQVDRQPLQAFLAVGEVGGGVLEAGVLYPPTDGGLSILKRGKTWVKYRLRATGLPPGAYTNWFAIFNNPQGCEGDCDLPDLLNPAANASVFWADGAIVGKNGIGKFRGKIREGRVPKAPGKFVLGPDGLADSRKAEIHIIVKYHGPVSKKRRSATSSSTACLAAASRVPTRSTSATRSGSSASIRRASRTGH